MIAGLLTLVFAQSAGEAARGVLGGALFQLSGRNPIAAASHVSAGLVEDAFEMQEKILCSQYIDGNWSCFGRRPTFGTARLTFVTRDC